MHACLNLDEIVRLIACEVVASRAKATAVAFARCHKSFEDPVLDTLWETQYLLLPLLRSLPRDVWNEDGCTSFKRFPTTQEWARFRKYARRIRRLNWSDFSSSEVFSVLQHCVINEPLFPSLKTVQFWYATGEFVPFIPLFLSPGIVTITIIFAESSNLLNVMVASVLTTFPTLCPNLRDIGLFSLPNDPTITAAVSGMLLSSNPTSLRSVRVYSPLTEGAHEVIFKLPNLHTLSVFIEGGTSLPTVFLPNLTHLTISYDHDGDWLKWFRGATLGKLESVSFHSDSEQISNFLEEFERVALATSTQNTLSEFILHMSCVWNPRYSSLLSFTQMVRLVVGSSCDDGCSSTVDDGVITALARAMPKLQLLMLGGSPCSEIPTGVTVKGLAVLAHHCPGLSTLRIHFQVNSLSAPPVIDVVPSDVGSTLLQRGCALAELEVGEIPVAEESVPTVALTLALIFPRMESIDYVDKKWQKVMDTISVSRKIVNYSRATLESGI